MSEDASVQPDEVEDDAADDVELERKLERIGELMKRMVRAVRVPDDQVELTPTQILVLSLLDEAPMRIGVLASAVGAAQNTTSEVVARMERCGLVLKTRDPADQRAVMVTIADQGRAALQTRRETMRSYHRGVLRALSPEDRQRFVEAFELLVSMSEQARAHVAKERQETRRRK